MDGGRDQESMAESDWTDGAENDGNTRECNVETKNRFEPTQNGGFEKVNRRKKRKYKSGSSGSYSPSNAFAKMNTDDKLINIFEQLHKNYDKIEQMENQQSKNNNEMKRINKSYLEMEERMTRMEQMFENEMLRSKVLTYKSIDAEARSMRNNIVVYGLTERSRYRNPKQFVSNFFRDELDIDTRDMYIERAHRMGEGIRGSRDPKRHMVIRFRDYVDTETIMYNVYKLRGSGFGIDRQYPREITKARSELYRSEEAKEARGKRQKVQIKFPAKLIINGKLIKDKFPDWNTVLGEDRMVNVRHIKFDKSPNVAPRRVYSNDTEVDHQSSKYDSDSNVSEVFETSHTHSTKQGTCENEQTNVNKTKTRDNSPKKKPPKCNLNSGNETQNSSRQSSRKGNNPSTPVINSKSVKKSVVSSPKDTRVSKNEKGRDSDDDNRRKTPNSSNERRQ